MRKVLSFVLVLSLVLGSFSMAFAATPATGFSDMNGEASAEAVSVLSDLDVVSGYPDGEYKPENIVTRAEMSVLVIRALGLTDFVTTNAKSSFPDMDGYGWAEGYIAYAESLGILSGYPDGTFKPGNTVTYDEVASMLVRALGYSVESLPGSWPANFVVKAMSLGILDGIQAGATGANRGDVAIMLYQTIDQRIGTVNKDGEWIDNDTTRNGEKPDTMLARLGAEFVSAAVITGLEESVVNIRPFIGANAETYLNSDDEIISVSVKDCVFLTGDYNAADKKFENGTDYNISDAVAAPTSGSAFGFVNGEYDSNDYSVASTAASEAGDFTIAANVSGKTITKVYSILVWDATDKFQFDSDFADEIADDQSIAGIDFILDNNDEIDMNEFALYGASDLDSIKDDNVVYVFAGDVTGDVRKIEVGTETAEGKITLVDGSKYTIGGKVYEKSANAFEVGDLALGNTGTAYLDYNGEIAVFEVEDADADNYAVVTGLVATSGRDQTIILFSKDGSEKEYVLDIATAPALTYGDVVTFSLNKSGEIDELTPVVMGGEEDDLELSNTRSVFDGKLVDAGVVVFTRDGAIGDADTTFDVVAITDIETGEELTGTTYFADPKVEVMMVDDSYTGIDNVYAVFNKINEAYDANDEKVQYANGFAAGKAYNAYTDDTGVIEGTGTEDNVIIWKLTVNSDNVITKAAPTTGEKTVVTGEVTDKDSSTLIYVDGTGWCTIDANAVVYEFDKDEVNEYTAKSLTSVKAKTDYIDGSIVQLYQLDKDSEVYDVIVIVK